MEKKDQLIKNTFIISLGKLSTQLISFFLLPLYTMYLSPNDYGLVDLIFTYITLMAPVSTMQMEMAAFRFLIDTRSDDKQKKEIISNILQIVFISSISIISLYLILIRFVKINYLFLILLNLLVVIVSGLFLQFARGLGKNKNFAIASTVTGIITLISTVIFVVNVGAGAGGVLTSIILANLGCIIYLTISLKLYEYIDFRAGNRELKKKLMRYSLPLVPNGLSWWVINVSDRTIISLVLGLAANGIYAVSNKFASIFTSVFSIFSMALTESASMHINDKDSDQFLSETNSASLKLFSSFGLALIAICSFVFTIFIGVKFQEASQYIPILIIAAFLNSVVGLYSAIYIAKKMTKKVATTSIIAAIINIILNIAFIKFIGIYAAALSTLAAFGAMAIFRHYDLKKYVTIKYEKYLFAKIIVAYLLVTGLYYLNNPIGNIFNIVIVVIIAITLNGSMINILKTKVFNVLSGIINK